ncbi:unnamed protein product [Phaedon cochleariae]|uniref:XK-related protein n=1 Tax=Phaedon cochleariae TaxID=80249 RepID=A0A9N9SBG1_PHACE|nr:unnamed protein product [Phaedon cochleariae]
MVSAQETNNKKSTLLGYELTPRQDALINHLVPAISASTLYIFLIAADVAVIVSHYRNGDPIWASLTLFFMFLPVLCSFVIIVSNWELWPEFEDCGKANMLWFWRKTFEHLFFPVWNMWRFAERIFWSIEAVRSTDQKTIKDLISNVTAPRSIELCIFLQSYLHALPQVLLQLYILMRHNTDIDRQTEKAQVMSIILNLVKVSVTTTYYQRFKSQKLTGKQYPWYKQYKAFVQPSSPEDVLRRSIPYSESRMIVEGRRTTRNLEDVYDLEPPRYSALRRRSSDIYLEPCTSDSTSKRQTLLETDFDEDIRTREKVVDEGFDEPDSQSKNVLNLPPTMRETSVLDGPRRMVFRETGISGQSEPDFSISRIVYVKGLEDDDLAGKLIACTWWFCFLLARVLAISVFAYFFIKETIWLLSAHFVIVMTFLLYDVNTDAVKRAKSVFFLFLALIYIFCIIEFKIKFKKATFLYYGFFLLVFIENFVMCSIWYTGAVETIEDDFWFRYTFYIVVMCTLASFSSMAFYFGLNKPAEVVVATAKIKK